MRLVGRLNQGMIRNDKESCGQGEKQLLKRKQSFTREKVLVNREGRWLVNRRRIIPETSRLLGIVINMLGLGSGVEKD